MKPDKKQPVPRTAPAGRHWTAHPAFICLWLAALTWGLYLPVGGHDYINLDDPNYVAANPNVQAGLTPGNVIWACRSRHAGYWQPVTWLSHMLDVTCFGHGPRGPHLVNVAFHAANSILLFLLLRRMTGATWRSALVAALFACHPLRVESVAWIQARRDMLSGFFLLLTLWYYVRFTDAKKTGPPRHPGRYFAWALVFFTLGLMSKPILVTLPFALLLLDFWPLDRMRAPSAMKAFPGLLREKIPFFLITLVFCVVTFQAQRLSGAVQTLINCPLNVRLENAPVSYVRYLGKLFWPVALATPYSDIQAWPPAVYGGAAVLLAILTGSAWWLRRRFPFVLMGWLWFLGVIVPVSGIVQSGPQSMADRFTYLPLIGLFIIVAWGGAALLVRWRLPAGLGAALAGIILVACVARTRDQLPYWQNSETLFRHTLAVTQNNWVAHSNLGETLDRHGRMDEALEQYRQAVAIQPNSAECLNNLGHALVRIGKYEEAVPLFKRALQAKPGYSEVHYNLAYALRNLERYDEAIVHYEMYLQEQADTPSAVTIAALKELGFTLGVRTQTAQAAARFEEVLRYRPDDADSHFNLALLLIRQGKVAEARRHLTEALRLQPGWTEAENQLRALDHPE